MPFLSRTTPSYQSRSKRNSSSYELVVSFVSSLSSSDILLLSSRKHKATPTTTTTSPPRPHRIPMTTFVHHGTPKSSPTWGKRSRDHFRKTNLMLLVCLVTSLLLLLTSPSMMSPHYFFLWDPPQPVDRSCSCPDTIFPKRSHQEDQQFATAWNHSVHYVQSHKLTYLNHTLLEFHRAKLSDIEQQGIPGMIFECGVAKGGSAIAFTSYKHPRRCLHLFDTFAGIPKPSEKDGTDVLERYAKIQLNKKNCELGLECDRTYYGNMDDLLAYDISHFEYAGYKHSENSVFFHKGLFDDTVWPVGPVAYAHLVGWGSSCGVGSPCGCYLSGEGFPILGSFMPWCLIPVVSHIFCFASSNVRTATGTIRRIICSRGFPHTFRQEGILSWMMSINGAVPRMRTWTILG